MAEFTQSEDVGARYEAYGWDVITLTDGHDLKAIYEAIEEAKANDNGKPTMIIAKTEIGRGIDEVAGTNAAHGEARKNLGLPADKWHVSDDTYKFFADRKAAQKSQYDAWQATYKAWQAANPEQAKILQDGIDGKTPSEAELLAAIPKGSGEAEATRISGSAIINDIAAAMPLYISGSADLHGSNKNYIKGAGDFGADFGKSYKGRNAYYGIFRPSGATFLVFADYMRAAVRIAALAELPVSYIWTHDSIGVGEDGPTHQPVETVSGLRAFPNLDQTGTTSREDTLKGGYVAVKETGDLKCIII